MGGGSDDIARGNRVGVQAGGDQAGDMGHVHHQLGIDFVGNGAQARKVEMARVGAGAGNDQLGRISNANCSTAS